MRDAVILVSMGENGIQIFDRRNTRGRAVMLQPGPECRGYRSFCSERENIYIISAFSSEVLRYNMLTGQLCRLCACVGRYPVKILSWNSYLLIACSETDTVEICGKYGRQSFISHRLGGMLNGIAVINEKCFAVCAQERAVYILSLPELRLLDSFYLEFIPNGVTAADGMLLVYGSHRYNDGFIAAYSAAGDRISCEKTGFNPVDALMWKDKIIVSCAGENTLCLHRAKDLRAVKAISLGDMPDKLCLAQNRLFVGMNYSGRLRIYDTETGILLCNMPVLKEPSDIGIISFC